MPQRFGRYWLHEQIGRGGMAEVFRATIGPDPSTFAFELALKRLLPQLQKDPAQVDMFITEADVAKLLRHPNIVQVYEAGSINGEAYIAMEYIRGHDLAGLIEALRKRRLRFPSDLAVYVVMQVLRALDYIHCANSASGDPLEIVHRDVSPSNIYVTQAGEVKLSDFGVARVKFLEGYEEARFLKGKAAYMPPEVLGGAPVTQAVDLWSLAVTLYEMVTARRAFEGVSEQELMSGVFKPRIVPAQSIIPDLAEGLAKILHRALALNPKKRPREAAELYRQLKMHMLGHGVAVDSKALARFVADTTGRQAVLPARPGGAGTPGEFESPTYQVPLGMSPTQRFEYVRRRRRLAAPLIGLLALGLVAGSSYLLFGRSLLRRMQGVPAAAIANPPESSGAGAGNDRGGAPAAAVPGEAALGAEAGAAAASDSERVRPIIPADFVIEFSEDFGDELELDRVKAVPRFDGLMRRARLMSQRRRFPAADEAFRQALELRPKHVPAMLGRANALLELRRYKEAEQIVRGALALRSTDSRAYLLLGDVLWVQGKDAMARQVYQKCVELDPAGKPARTAKRILSNL